MQISALRNDRSAAERNSLPTAHELIDALNRLFEAQDKEDTTEEKRIVREIEEFVKPGTYKGFLGDDLQASSCYVLAPERRDKKANIHTFCVKLRRFDLNNPSPVGEMQKMDLIDFLAEIHRERDLGGHTYVGPRFWPY